MVKYIILPCVGTTTNIIVRMGPWSNKMYYCYIWVGPSILYMSSWHLTNYILKCVSFFEYYKISGHVIYWNTAYVIVYFQLSRSFSRACNSRVHSQVLVLIPLSTRRQLYTHLNTPALVFDMPVLHILSGVATRLDDVREGTRVLAIRAIREAEFVCPELTSVQWLVV
jgi:hypothetical protein